MKKKLSIIAVTACLLAASNGFAAEPNRSYVELFGKYTMMGDVEATELVELDTEGGWGISGAIGTHVIKMLKIEVEVGAQKNDIDHLEIGNQGEWVTRSGDIEIDSLLANVYADIPVGKGFSVYVGGGLGASIFTLSAYDVDEDETVFTYKFGAGVSYAITPEFGVDLGYEYLATEDAEIDGIEVTDIASNNIVLGLKYMF